MIKISADLFAYRPGYSAVLQLMEGQNDWALLLNEKVPVDVIYTDFKSAFEMVTHSKLLSCLPSYGVGPKLTGLGTFLPQ